MNCRVATMAGSFKLIETMVTVLYGSKKVDVDCRVATMAGT
jgi:hypothetical protein